MDLALVRRAWQVSEPVHGMVYFAPETRAATDALGVRGGWMSYFGCRISPLGAVSAATVTAVLYNLAPAMVAKSVPAIWTYASPDQLVTARLTAVDAALRRILGPRIDSPELHRAAHLATIAATAVNTAGRPLAAGNAAIPLPNEPHLALWQALTTIREHRGDGHIAVLTTTEVSPCEAHVLADLTGRAPEQTSKRMHWWTDEDWDAAVERLCARGWLASRGVLTAAGARARERIEADTDRLAAPAYRALGPDRVEELIRCVRPLADIVMDIGAVPLPNAAGLTWPPE